MQPKNLLTAGLLLFVMVAVVTIVIRQRPEEPTREQASESEAPALPADVLVAYYFHGETRCPTCRNLESYAHEAVAQGFADELARGDISWQVVNYETAENAHFAEEYEIIAPSVVLVHRTNGQQTDWRNLPRIWELVGDKEAFVQYIQQETAELLSAGAGA